MISYFERKIALAAIVSLPKDENEQVKKMCVELSENLTRKGLAERIGMRYSTLTAKMSGYNYFSQKDKKTIESVYNNADK